MTPVWRAASATAAVIALASISGRGFAHELPPVAHRRALPREESRRRVDHVAPEQHLTTRRDSAARFAPSEKPAQVREPGATRATARASKESEAKRLKDESDEKSTLEERDEKRTKNDPDEKTARHERDAPKRAAHKPTAAELAKSPWLRYVDEPWRRGFVTLFGHGKKWSGYLVGKKDKVLPEARKTFSEALASWRTGKAMLIDERLIRLVAKISDEFGGRPVRIVSGYREFSYAPGSKHKVGQAFDFSIPGVPNDALKDYLRTFHAVGVGYYPNSTHVHLDVRDENTYWVDYSSPGDRPMYAWQRRVPHWGAHERAIAAALDALPLGILSTGSAVKPSRTEAADDEREPDENDEKVAAKGAAATQATAPADAGAPLLARDGGASAGHDAGTTHDAGARF
jgi:hypothetical protein